MRCCNLSLLISILVVLPLAVSAARIGGGGAVVGGWKPIEDINDAHVKEIAEFAVSEYNKENGKNLVLEKIVKGETQVVAGENYRLLLAVKDHSEKAKYESVVYERSWEHTRKLVSFDQVKK